MTARKCKTVGIHLNDVEHAKIKERATAAAARSLGAYIKAVVFNIDIPEQRTVRHTKVADPALIRELVWIGNNVNQIAHVINQSEHLGKVESASLFAALAIIAEELEALNEVAL